MLTVGWVQCNGLKELFLPYSVGILQAYTLHHAPQAGRYQFLLPLFRQESVPEAVTALSGADVVGFSTYIWNMQRSLAIAEMLKLQSPQTLIVFGGPQVPDHAQPFMASHPFVDICVHGPGEAIFLALLEAFPQNEWSDIPGVSYFAPDGIFHSHPKPPRMQDLDNIPSPYLMGIFDPLIAQYPEQSWFVAWETNRGCPFACTFCDWGSSIQSKVFRFDLERVKQEINWFATHRIATVFGCDANFGILPRDVDIAHYLALVKRHTGYPLQVGIQGTKNATERAFQVYQILYDAGLNTEVTLSMQSVNPDVLQQIRRENISLDTYLELQQRFNQLGISTYTDMILGLPGETYASFADGLATVIEHGQHSRIKFYHAMILPNAEMAQPEYRQRYGLQTIFTNIAPPNAVDGLCETHEIVVATNTMGRDDLAKMRIYAWIAGYLYFGKKMLQIPFVLLHQAGGLSYRQLIEAFMAEGLSSWPLLQRMHAICQGKTRYLYQPVGQKPSLPDEYLDFSAETHLPLLLCRENQVDAFYRESLSLLVACFLPHCPAVPLRALVEAVTFNQILFKLDFLEKNQNLRPHFAYEKPCIDFQYNIPDYYQGVLCGNPIELQQLEAVYYKNWLDAPYVLKKKPLPSPAVSGVNRT